MIEVEMIEIECRRHDYDHSLYAFYIKGTRILHKENGPAVISLNGNFNGYFLNGKCHRTDGPAKIWFNTGNKEYWLNGQIADEIESDAEWIIKQIIE